MEYNYEDLSEIPDLSKFKDDLIEDLLSTALFQHKSDKKYNMLSLPLLMAPCLLAKQVNNDKTKKTIMEKEYSFTEETLQKFQEMVERKVALQCKWLQAALQGWRVAISLAVFCQVSNIFLNYILKVCKESLKGSYNFQIFHLLFILDLVKKFV